MDNLHAQIEDTIRTPNFEMDEDAFAKAKILYELQQALSGYRDLLRSAVRRRNVSDTGETVAGVAKQS